MNSLTSTYRLSNGYEIPVVGFGTWQTPDGDVAVSSVKEALAAGYRHIDTAQGYKNEESVGQAIKESGIPREEIFLTTKLWNANHSYELVMSSFEESLKKLQTDYVDLQLLFVIIGNKQTQIHGEHLKNCMKQVKSKQLVSAISCPTI